MDFTGFIVPPEEGGQIVFSAYAMADDGTVIECISDRSEPGTNVYYKRQMKVGADYSPWNETPNTKFGKKISEEEAFEILGVSFQDVEDIEDKYTPVPGHVIVDKHGLYWSGQHEVTGRDLWGYRCNATVFTECAQLPRTIDGARLHHRGKDDDQESAWFNSSGIHTSSLIWG